MIWQASAIAPRMIHGTVDGRPMIDRCWMINSIAARSKGSHAAAAIMAQDPVGRAVLDAQRSAAPGAELADLRARAPVLRLEPGRIEPRAARLCGGGGIEQNRAIVRRLQRGLDCRRNRHVSTPSLSALTWTPACPGSLATIMPENAHSPASPPDSVCLLRTSALGDVTHVVPLVRTLQGALPATRLTWIVGRLEHRLVGDIAGVEFVVFDKAKGLGGFADVRRQLAGRRFAALLHLQVALRANLLSALVRAPLRVGYDAARSRDLHGLFVNKRIAARSGEHVLDAIASFAEPLGVKQSRVIWDLPVPEAAREFAERHLPGTAPTLLVRPCSSHVVRNWLPERYSAVIDHAGERGWRVALCGGPSAYERGFADAILARCTRAPIDLVGKDTLKQLPALLETAEVIHVTGELDWQLMQEQTRNLRQGVLGGIRYGLPEWRTAGGTSMSAALGKCSGPTVQGGPGIVATTYSVSPLANGQSLTVYRFGIRFRF